MDCEAAINVILQKYVYNICLQPSTTRLKIWNGIELVFIGKCRIVLHYSKNMKKYSVKFTIVKETVTLFLGKCVSEQLNLIAVHYNNITNVSSVPESKQLLTNYARNYSRAN